MMPKLTITESATVSLAAKGLSNKEIAEARKVSIKTVKYHLWKAFKKLGVKTRCQLIVLYAKLENT